MKKHKEYNVLFSCQMKARVRVKEGESLQEAIDNIPIPESESPMRMVKSCGINDVWFVEGSFERSDVEEIPSGVDPAAQDEAFGSESSFGEVDTGGTFGSEEDSEESPPKIDLCFQGWLRRAPIKQVDDLNGKIVDVSNKSTQELVQKLQSGEWMISLQNVLEATDDREIEIFDFASSEEDAEGPKWQCNTVRKQVVAKYPVRSEVAEVDRKIVDEIIAETDQILKRDHLDEIEVLGRKIRVAAAKTGDIRLAPHLENVTIRLEEAKEEDRRDHKHGLYGDDLT